MKLAEMEKDKGKIVDACLCMNCPSYEECGDKGGFCVASVKKSKCIKREKGCICGGCPVHSDYELNFMYYCTRGSEKQLAKKK